MGSRRTAATRSMTVTRLYAVGMGGHGNESVTVMPQSITCEECQRKGLLRPMEEVHHKLPLAEGGTHDEGNLVSLCQSCHARIHAERGDRWNKR